MQRITATLIVLATILLVTACGGSGGTTHTATVTHTVTHSGSTSAASTPSTSTSTAPTTTQSSATAHARTTGCRAAGLALTYLGGQGATGHGLLGFQLRNTGSATCTTGGYPGVLFLAGSGAALPTSPQHTTSDFFGRTVLAPLSLAPGQSASFRLGVSHVSSSASGAGCVSAAAVQVIAPNDTATMRVTIPGGASECGGTVTVSPLQPGDSAYH